MLDTLLKFIPTYQGVTPLMFGMYLLAGVFGALVRVSWLDKPIRGFYRVEGQPGLQMGFYAEVVTAMAVAVMVDGHPIRAGIASIFAPWILEGVKVALVEKVPAMVKAALTTAVNGGSSNSDSK